MTQRAPAGLAVEDLRVAYGRTEVLHGVSLHVDPGECVAIIGRNGAGKSTLLNTVAGSGQVTGGRVLFAGEDITRLKPHQRARRGLVSTMEGHRIFQMQSVIDNLEIAGFAGRRSRSDQRDDLERVCELFPILAEKSHRKASTLSGGQQQMLAIAQALMARPSVLMLDEPSAGLAPLLVEELFESLAQLANSTDLTILIVEQAVSEVLRIVRRGYVLNLGEVVIEGSASELAANPEVAQVYIGRGVSSTKVAK